ncbi:UbiX family flavin prenyltransferase [Fervidicoccus fontis]|jgi:4-hydroxy-3-polyprenylbenzoate decarboxylase|uniref:Flavin prenyltransferase UbiX n=2 Tax=Fervidicoccus fontis TaxID=683846 RepID=I0A177_FERFK|nr:UbiX family flavin prenyltransferase [Fervidicoccus fontis]AFH42734.1 Flavoprotein, 3-polyprenyl-4-hydroxybenzoate decarboxylase, UbiX [Fervidicoccus fontis Kam940]MBE9391312.1 UbiX family flavin prenyltransferase [Fervidicoccus fontis]PMB76288.1 MAG: dipicolinate synthase subunit B [Fervidicoccus fontis]HEW64363.1 UbiX family flavin prenyltransferase [Fervidicoccus fontis]
MKRIVVALTGASGIIYGKKLIEVLVEKSYNMEIIYTEHANLVSKLEEGVSLEEFLVGISKKHSDKIKIYKEKDFMSPLASSSNIGDAMVIVPCSVKTLSQISYGISDNLVVRAALAFLRMKKKLVVVPRETPLGLIELNAMVELAKAGAIILPAMPAFYHKPKGIDDIVNFIVGKILDALGIENDLYERWGKENSF